MERFYFSFGECTVDLRISFGLYLILEGLKFWCACGFMAQLCDVLTLQ